MTINFIDSERMTESIEMQHKTSSLPTTIRVLSINWSGSVALPINLSSNQIAYHEKIKAHTGLFILCDSLPKELQMPNRP